MSDNFQKTVNLRDKMEGEKKPRTPVKRKVSRPSKGADQIDELFNDNEHATTTRKELQHIEKVNRGGNEDFFKKMIFVLIVLLGVSLFFGFFYNKGDEVKENQHQTDNAKWYAVRLVSGEVYYGQVNNTTADPVVVDNVYYDYDQISANEENKNEASNLRLVKRGKETHGPDGSMSIIRAQVKYIEPLKEGSKVLNAILDYEKQ